MSGKPLILVVDDIPSFCRFVADTLRDAGLDSVVCTSPAQAVELAAGRPFSLIMTTLVMREMGGFDLIRQVRGRGVQTPIIMITGYGTQETAIEATRLGVTDYLTKPIAPGELVARVRRALGEDDRGPAGSAAQLESLITCNFKMKAIFETVRTIARSSSRVLILGETGTGKELIARAIHAESKRARRPFVAVNCAAIPENLLESELFGHERGAFTGATNRRIGRFEQAGNGTIFLDEIGEMSYTLQSKLLHVLEGGRFQRVGGERELVSDARLLAATNRDLEKEVESGRFRADLFYRLNVVSISLPPLRERLDDIPVLVAHFAKRFVEPGRDPVTFTPAAIEALQRYPWPGNVRELQNLIERIVVLHEDPEVGVSALPKRVLHEQRMVAVPAVTSATPFREAKAQFERQYVEFALEAARGNFAAAARAAGLDRAQFYRLAQRYGFARGRGTMTDHQQLSESR